MEPHTDRKVILLSLNGVVHFPIKRRI